MIWRGHRGTNELRRHQPTDTRCKGERPPPDDVSAEARTTYAGPLVVGKDLMQFVVGEVIEVRRFDPVKQGY